MVTSLSYLTICLIFVTFIGKFMFKLILIKIIFNFTCYLKYFILLKLQRKLKFLRLKEDEDMIIDYVFINNAYRPYI